MNCSEEFVEAVLSGSSQKKMMMHFRLKDLSIAPPEMVVDVSEMGMPSACRNLFAIANAHNW